MSFVAPAGFGWPFASIGSLTPGGYCPSRDHSFAVYIPSLAYVRCRAVAWLPALLDWARVAVFGRGLRNCRHLTCWMVTGRCGAAVAPGDTLRRIIFCLLDISVLFWRRQGETTAHSPPPHERVLPALLPMARPILATALLIVPLLGATAGGAAAAQPPGGADLDVLLEKAATS